MQKIILITGSTDGIGLETARQLVSMGHFVLLHGRNPEKLSRIEEELLALPGAGCIESYVADLSRMSDVSALAKAVAEKHSRVDVLINNAGIFRTSEPITQDGLDVRFAVNTIAPFKLAQSLLPLFDASSRVINLSSAAQAPVNLDALVGQTYLSDEMAAYAQSKLALTMWSRNMALAHEDGPAFIAVNPGSLLATKMVKEGFGVAGKSINIGADILIRASLSEEFSAASGKYFDNDSGRFASPHPDALDPQKTERLVQAIETCLTGRD